MSGLDISYDTRKRRKAADPSYRMLAIPDRLVEMGRKGLKTSGGWYDYVPGDRTPRPSPVVTEIIREESEKLGNKPRQIGDEEILHRLLFGSINEFCKILEEGKAIRASDLDVMWLHGFGFPRWRGGLMFWGDTIGAREIYNRIAAWHQQYGARWRPSELLREVAEGGGKLSEIKAKALK
jgi:3-hydroxyacyl-CoA dehydrogenase